MSDDSMDALNGDPGGAAAFKAFELVFNEAVVFLLDLFAVQAGKGAFCDYLDVSVEY